MLLSALVCAGGLGIAVFTFVMAGRHPAAVLPGLVIFAATAAMTWTPMGESRVGRVGLGLLVVGAALAVMGLLFFVGGRNPSSLMLGAIFLAAAVALTFGVPVSDTRIGYVGILAWVCITAAMAAMGVLFVRFGPGFLVIGSYLLIISIGVLVGHTTTGQVKFALGIGLAVVVIMLTYLYAIGSSPAGILFGAMSLAALWSALKVDEVWALARSGRR
ncbi:hypothetical protein [Actinokineospora xionganensis]|uniref:DUF4203 domain-containing protein n=1 Tax=Actinokineospora xionganensis TaxID=2684470 RepID=A0ABR7L0X3_9PSEU|nr:hypothetical protein [Actinokineospora xionganensis]MBC6446326.1 hypothetical protein [Actinokineospora xionganensis]